MIITEESKKPHYRKEVPIRFKKTTQEIIIKSEICIKCGICANVCPRKAIYSINLLEEPKDQAPTHLYSSMEPAINIDLPKSSGFRLYGLPTLVPGRVTGFCGPNGIGKSTVLNILAGTLKPNFGNLHVSKNEDWKSLVKNIKEAEMRDYFKELDNGVRKVAYKQQVLRILFDQYRGQQVFDILLAHKNIEDVFFQQICSTLDIDAIATRQLEECSGGELQRFAIALVLVQDADCYLVDEPCTFLDVKKRIKLAELLQARARGFGGNKTYPVLVVEHDLAILDYVSDVVHLFFGQPHQYGIITKVQTTKAGINSYLDGFLKTENTRFRKNQIGFKRSVGGQTWSNARILTQYQKMIKTFEGFRLEIEPGIIYESEILGVVGENGCGKSTFAKILAGQLKPDPNLEGIVFDFAAFVSYKPQYITKDFPGTVREFIGDYSQNYDFSEDFMQILYVPVGVDQLLDKKVSELSGGELQRVYICACLAKRANLYILDEPSAYLDVEERLHIASIIRTLTKRSNAASIVIEHDIQICDAVADRLLLFTGTPGVHGITVGPLNKREGMNAFLQLLDITFRRDEDTGRARINKKDSGQDKAQRAAGEYFYD
jgi:ATP-binding cassette subfamily E protein 1